MLSDTTDDGMLTSSRRAKGRRRVKDLLDCLTCLHSCCRMPSLSNTAATFFLLWAGEKGAEFAAGRFVWLTVFGGSIALWQVNRSRRETFVFTSTCEACQRLVIRCSGVG